MKKLLLLLLVISVSGCISQAPSERTEKYVLDNGMTLIVKENHANMIVATKLLIKSGAWSESNAEMGTRNFVQQMLLKGTAKRNAEDIAFETESKGISLSTGVADDYLEITMVSTKDFFVDGMEVLADIVMNPRFPEKEVKAERLRILEGLKAQEDDQFTSTYLLFKGELYGDHPYGYNQLGTPESLFGIDRDDLLRFRDEHYLPNNMVLAVVGDVTAEEVRDMIEESFKGFQPGELPVTPEFTIRGEKASVSVEKDRAQTFIIIGYRTSPVIGENYPALKILNSILGGGSSARLYERIRGARGLAYAVGSFYPSRTDDSFIAAYIGTAPENEDEVEKLMLREFEELKSTQVPQEELTIAKNRIIGDFELDHESNERQAFYLAWYEAIGMGYGYDSKYTGDLEKVTSEDVQQVAQKYLENSVTARVGPADET
ncbi:MAG: pitrilysin family protein [Candidatus Hydrothermarchaeales archaeon]